VPEARSLKPIYFHPCRRVKHSNGTNLLSDFIIILFERVVQWSDLSKRQLAQRVRAANSTGGSASSSRLGCEMRSNQS
jgi:hypothetical protein